MLALLGRALALAAGGTALGLAVNAVRPDGLSFRAGAAPAVCQGPAAPAGVEVLPPEQAVRLCGDARVLVADARPPARFAEGHVAGALHLPCAASGSAAASAITRLADKHTLIVYGDSTDEARPVADELRRRVERGGLRVVVLDGGFPAWSRAGLACSSGPCPDCAEKGPHPR